MPTALFHRNIKRTCELFAVDPTKYMDIAYCEDTISCGRHSLFITIIAGHVHQYRRLMNLSIHTLVTAEYGHCGKTDVMLEEDMELEMEGMGVRQVAWYPQ